jgi:hypothetical protein
MVLDYEALFEGLREAYDGRALDLLSTLAQACHDAGLDADDPYYARLDDISWECVLSRHDGSADCAATLELAEQREHDGDDEGHGLNFSLTVTRDGGQIVACIAPFNYTLDVWVDATDADAVAARWALFAEVVARSAPAIAEEVRG